MATFSTNQVRQVYVVSDVDTVSESANVGTLAVNSGSNITWLEYKGADTVLRSDLITQSKVKDARATRYDKLSRGLKKFELTIDTAINGGNPVTGQEYIVGLTFREFISNSPDNQDYVNASVYATSTMTKSDLLIALKNAIVKNLSHDIDKRLSITVNSEVTATKIIIEEVEQPWILGKKSSVPVNVDIQTRQITYNGDSLNWGVVTQVASTTTVNDGRIMADLEYFLMGERGDIYRGMGFPNNINTTYLVSPSTEYNVIDITFAYSGENESVQESRKVLSLLVPAVGSTVANKVALANEVIAALNSNGITISALATS